MKPKCADIDWRLYASPLMQNGATPLYIACSWGHLDIVKELIESCVDVDAKTSVSFNTNHSHEHGRKYI
jgi:ankyrin repeat protein